MLLARVSLVGVAAVLAGLFGPLGVQTPIAKAGPMPSYCYDQRLCDGDFGDTSYCPDTGGFVGPFAACDALVTGPYAPGGLSPNESRWDDGEDR